MKVVCKWGQNQVLLSRGEKSVVSPLDGIGLFLDDVSLLSAIYNLRSSNIATLESESQSPKRCDLDNALFSTEAPTFPSGKLLRQ